MPKILNAIIKNKEDVNLYEVNCFGTKLCYKNDFKKVGRLLNMQLDSY